MIDVFSVAIFIHRSGHAEGRDPDASARAFSPELPAIAAAAARHDRVGDPLSARDRLDPDQRFDAALRT